MLANLQAGYEAVSAFERTNAAVDAVLRQTWEVDAYELQLIAAQGAFVDPVIAHRPSDWPTPWRDPSPWSGVDQGSTPSKCWTVGKGS